MRAALLAAAICITTKVVHAENLVIGAWNIADLHHAEGVEARPGIGTSRDAHDFEAIIKYSKMFGRDETEADVIALQEIGTKEGAHRVFPSADFDVLMSQRYKDDEGAGNDIYTAIAIRKDSGVTVVRQQDLMGLAIEDSEGYSTRAGTAALLEFEGIRFWFLSVHLKASCSHVLKADTSSRNDCELLWEQMDPLVGWIKARRSEGTPYIIAGDFNRRFRQFKNEGPVWTTINGGDLGEPWMSQHPERVTRRCPTRKGKSTQPIDWILIDVTVAHWFVEGSFWETRFSNADVRESDRKISDHCPISITIDPS